MLSTDSCTIVCASVSFSLFQEHGLCWCKITVCRVYETGINWFTTPPNLVSLISHLKQRNVFISTSSRNTCNSKKNYLWVWLNFWTSLPPSASLIWMLVTGWEGSRFTEALAWASLAAWSCWEVGGAEINSGVALERKGKKKKPKHDQIEQVMNGKNTQCILLNTWMSTSE